MIKQFIFSGVLLASMFDAIARDAIFDNFSYQGRDAAPATKLAKGAIANPLLSGFYPDPSICRKGNDYYMVNSTFSYFPGIPLWHSKNLRDWNQIGHVLDRPEQVQLQGLGLSDGVYAPDISYNPYNDTFYVINTVVGGIGNYLVKTKNPRKGWSDVVKLPIVKGIDPSIFYDDDGKAYILSSHYPPKSEWNGHRAIYLYEFDYHTDSVGEPQVVVDGGYNRPQHPKWLEGPHLYKKDGIYYLIMAEGGTHSGHRQVAFFSDNVAGPYQECQVNPILSQLGLPEERSDKVINVGHADFVTTPAGDWYAVFLGCRPYEGKLYNTGRETFILPVTWRDNTPVILEEGDAVPNVSPKNFNWTDRFNSKQLKQEWNGIRALNPEWVSCRDGKLQLTLLPEALGEKKEVAFVGRRQQHLQFSSSVEISFLPENTGEFAGMLLMQNESNYVGVGVTLIDGTPSLQALRVENGQMLPLASVPLSEDNLQLFFDADNGSCTISYCGADKKKHELVSGIDITHLSTDKAKGFVGCYVGMYATANFPQPAKTVFVSPEGNGRAAGDFSHPVATTEQALKLLRPYIGKAKTDVVFLDGTHYFDTTLMLDSTYSASAECPLTFRALNPRKAVWSGGEQLHLRWEKWHDGIYKAQVPETVENIDQLYIDGQAQRMARFPNAVPGKNIFDTWNLKEPVKAGLDPLEKSRVARWKNPKGAYLHAMHNSLWGDMHWMVTGLANDSTLTMKGGWQNNRPSPMHPDYRMIENVLEELDVAGEWFFDKDSHILYLYPNEDVDLTTAKVEIVKLESLAELHGSMAHPVRNISFEGLLFRHTARTFMKNREPLLRSDWTVYRNGTLLFTGTENCKVKDCEFDQVGGNTIVVNNYNKNVDITGCYIHHSGANGVVFVGNTEMVRSPLFGYVRQDYATVDRTPGPLGYDFPQDCRVEDCLITRTGRHEKQTAPVQISMSYGITVSHCSLYDVPRAGININEGTFGGHVIEYCDVFDTVLETGDHGSFNSWGRDRYWTGNVSNTAQEVDNDPTLPGLDMLAPNTIRFSRWRCDHGWDIDLDDGSSFYHIHDNVLLKGGLKLREGYGRVVKNNLILNSSLHPHVWYHNSGDVVTGNIFYRPYQPAIMNRDIADNGKWGECVDRNFFVNDQHRRKFSKNACDSASMVFTPEFADASIGNYTLPQNSVPVQNGFRNLKAEYGVVSPWLKAIARTPAFPEPAQIEAEKAGKRSITWQGLTLKTMDTQGELSAVGYKELSGVLVLDVATSSPWHGLLSQGDLIIGDSGGAVAHTGELPESSSTLIIWRNQQKHIISK